RSDRGGTRTGAFHVGERRRGPGPIAGGTRPTQGVEGAARPTRGLGTRHGAGVRPRKTGARKTAGRNQEPNQRAASPACLPPDEAKIEALRQLDAVRFTSEDEKRVEAVSAAVQERTTKRRRLDELTTLLRQVGDVAARLADLGVQRAALEAERSFLEAEVANLRPAQEAFTAAKARLEALQGDLDQERKAWNLLDAEANDGEEDSDAVQR